MQAIYVIAGGDWLSQTLNAIVAFMNTDNWVIIRRIVTALSVLVVAITWIRRHNVMDMLGWIGTIVLMSLLVSVRTPVQIIDNSDLTKVYQVDNVPVGLALPASLTTTIGHALVQGYEMVFSQPDSVTYSKTGMLFGANLVACSTDFLSKNPEITTLFADYVQNCVMGDIFLNGKYTLDELMNSTDPYTIIFSKPSPLRQVQNYKKFTTSGDNGQTEIKAFLSCEEAAVILKQKLGLDTQTGGKSWSYYARWLFGGRPNPDLLLSQMLGESYNYFYNSGQSASQIIRQNVTMNALRDGIMGYAARNGDTSSLLNIATTSSMEKQRLAHATVGQVALRSLPMSQTLIVGLIIGIFPLMVLGGMFNAVTLNVLKGYVLAIMWVQSWPLLYAILNSCMTFYAKANGSPVVLSELSQVQLKYSDLATTAGYLSMLIPPLAWGMLKGLGSSFSNLYSHLASSAISPAATAAAGSIDGNYSYANMQTENVSGNSWNTNSSTMFGQMSQQLGNGATSTQMRDGSTVTDSTQAASKLPVSINFARQLASAQQEMAREAQTQSQSAMQSFSSSMSSTWQTLSQFGTNRGGSDSMTQGADSMMSAQDSMMASKMRSAVESYAKAHNISNDQATQELATRSTRDSLGFYGDAHVKGSMGVSVLGTGVQVGGQSGVKAGRDFEDNDSHNASNGSRVSQDARHDVDAKASQDFKEASDYFTSRKVSESGSHTDNNAASRADQLSASLSSAKQSLEQYSTSQARSKEFAEMASRTESMSGQINEDLNQQFAQYVRKQAPHDADTLLTDTSSPEVANKRRELAWSFVQEQVQPSIDAVYSSGRSEIGASMDGISSGGKKEAVMADYQSHKNIIDQRTQDNNIRNDVKDQVEDTISGYRSEINTTGRNIRDEEQDIKQQYSGLQNHHKEEELSQNRKYHEEKTAQERLPGADTPDELLNKAREYQDKNS
ncbi:conjugal transfer mating pair stabilization protein TraG [Pantoea sp. Bo_2]|uniref:Conjugal transfer mating pair stabilization protein TraG n=1 Tax=Candidatus Pantoea gossypiicola TaxID=2608008 RepID=A0AB34CF78_9GAMM|nr:MULTISPECIES: conjugal transfer mating-pair stabilization protein TraG [Pantoea]KAA5922285.1 conjugal transfer mating pair stabilization protein TraG [Pantoea sp. VH_8]KAA5929979.1 conjugal transfer mating pair stabilization protein TraG [Pantoea sp. VH_4]KAA5937454.1 conjugal transfer mating pair stabilization protein TraG [Pantoea sp. VH_3]KAA5946516.1 conjugal transfer mating pair stabilization protein TraG [Pantoea sp. VH_25]KAA5977087.1 conjugal transfer mating pair stabilization prote